MNPLERVRAFCDGWAKDHGGRLPIVEEGGNYLQLALEDLEHVLNAAENWISQFTE